MGYTYNIGEYEVTAGQYTSFLNAVAPVSDTYGLYNENMWINSRGCKIQQTGSAGSYSYSVASDYANRPVNYVSYWDACRFANWLDNGQGIGSSETGAYTLGGYNGTDVLAIQRNSEWSWAVASDNEWYKAAYYEGGGLYSLYANGTSTAPAAGTASNYNLASDHTWDGSANGVFEQNGTKDMMGNVWEWNEGTMNGLYRVQRGGWYYDVSTALQASTRGANYSTYEAAMVGFRVVQAVPEPSSIIALLGGLAGVVGIRRRKE